MTEAITNAASSVYNTASQSTKETSDMGRDEFLKLLTYQLQSQNPLKPYDNQEFAAQLAQFSQLEMMSDIRTAVEEQIQANSILTQTIANTALPGLLGKSAKTITSLMQYNGEPVELGYYLPYSAKSGKLNISDESGNLVRTINIDTLEDLSKGDHTLEWDGTNFSGEYLPQGNYRFSVEMNDGASSFSADTFTRGKIEAVRFKSEGTVLVINGNEVQLQNVSDITTD